MKVPAALQGERLTDALKGMGVGAALIVAIGFNWFGPSFGLGWTLGGSAKEASKAAVLAALAPVCADQVRANPEALAALKNTKSSDYDDVARKFITDTGPVKMDYAFARICGNELERQEKAKLAAQVK